MSIFGDPRFRASIQRAVLDTVVIDGPGTYSIVVPDRLVDAIEEIVAPHLKQEEDSHG